MRTAAQIASDVLVKIADDEWNTAQLATAGGGLGAGLGLTLSGISRAGDIDTLLRLHYQKPQLQKSREALDALLSQFRKQQPELKDMSARKLTKVLMQNELPQDMAHVVRQGYEEGISGLSRHAKLTNLMRKRLIRSGIFGGALGLGAGIGGGLLAAAGSGKFD